MHRDQAGAGGGGQARGERAADQQGADQARAGGIGDARKLGLLQTGGLEGLGHQGVDAPGVVAGGQFRYHSAVLGVHRRLAVQHMRQQAALAVVDRRGGLVAGGFNAEDGGHQGIVTQFTSTLDAARSSGHAGRAAARGRSRRERTLFPFRGLQ